MAGCTKDAGVADLGTGSGSSDVKVIFSAEGAVKGQMIVKFRPSVADSLAEALAASPRGIDTLLDGDLQKADALSSRVYHIQPGSTLDVAADRMEGARYLAVVAGYAHLRPELCSSVLPFPVHEETKGLLFRTRLYSAASLQALIRLGAESVSISGVERVR